MFYCFFLISSIYENIVNYIFLYIIFANFQEIFIWIDKQMIQTFGFLMRDLSEHSW